MMVCFGFLAPEFGLYAIHYYVVRVGIRARIQVEHRRHHDGARKPLPFTLYCVHYTLYSMHHTL